jgi:hypothetical protein
MIRMKNMTSWYYGNITFLFGLARASVLKLVFELDFCNVQLDERQVRLDGGQAPPASVRATTQAMVVPRPSRAMVRPAWPTVVSSS